MNLIGVAALVVLLVLLSGLRIAREYQRAVVFRLGRYTGLRGPGLFWLIPLGIENETRIDLRVLGAQALYGISAFGDGFVTLADGLVKRADGLFGAPRKQVACRLK